MQWQQKEARQTRGHDGRSEDLAARASEQGGQLELELQPELIILLRVLLSRTCALRKSCRKDPGAPRYPLRLPLPAFLPGPEMWPYGAVEPRKFVSMKAPPPPLKGRGEGHSIAHGSRQLRNSSGARSGWELSRAWCGMWTAWSMLMNKHDSLA
mmetsp:Transcript_69515/g.153728  ORF Transcript_69515/g.153728 Transcript_69515/m.153728 type:complete len:154 (+) Transcript_69515:237-698(+)